MQIEFDTFPNHLAIHFTAVDINDPFAMLIFAMMDDLCIVVGRSPVKSRTKTIDPRQPIKFGRAFRGDGTKAEFLARVTVVEDLCVELVRQHDNIGRHLPDVMIMMLFDENL